MSEAAATAETGRVLTCTRCREAVHVYELPHAYIDPELYVCGWCLDNRQRPPQLELVERTETRPYDPALAAIPF